MEIAKQNDQQQHRAADPRRRDWQKHGPALAQPVEAGTGIDLPAFAGETARAPLEMRLFRSCADANGGKGSGARRKRCNSCRKCSGSLIVTTSPPRPVATSSRSSQKRKRRRPAAWQARLPDLGIVQAHAVA
jgi:hypothetical protein